MESRTARKRPWEDEHPVDYPIKRPDPIVVTGERHAPPLPQLAGHHPYDSQTLSQRRLPPLSTPSCSASTELLASSSTQLPSSVLRPDAYGTSQPRSQSLLGIFPHSQDRRHRSPIERTTVLHDDLSTPSDDITARQTRLATELTPHSAEKVICCPSNCPGQACTNVRLLTGRLATELASLNAKVRFVLRKEDQSLQRFPETDHFGIENSLQWALELVQWTNVALQGHASELTSPIRESQVEHSNESPIMKRGHSSLERAEQTSPVRQTFGLQHGGSNYAQTHGMPEDNRRSVHGSEFHTSTSPPHNVASPTGSIPMPPHSPLQAQQPSRSGMLPSPSSMSFSNITNLPPMSPPSSSFQSSAQAAHLQDLQHQISVKTLAFQTLQREYDSLLQKLERQRTKCATLEKKFEVSDVEINSLTDEKEKLQLQVASLEGQLEDVQQSRDDARRQLVANGAQYMRIMDMANRLQAQGADDKKKWELEKIELEQRIKALEEAMVTGTEATIPDQENPSNPSSSTSAQAHMPTSSAEAINVLRAEVGRLRSRTQALEMAMQTMKENNISIQAAARQMMESSGKIEEASREAMRG